MQNADAELVPEYSPEVLQVDLAQRQRAHDDRHRLVAGIAALGRYYRHQRGQNRHGRDCAGELGHNRRRYQCRSQIDYKPWEAGADGAGQGAENDGLFTYLGQAIDVFGGFLLEYVYHIVYGDDAKQAILFTVRL